LATIAPIIIEEFNVIESLEDTIAPIIIKEFNVIESLEDISRASQQHESTKRSKMHGGNWFLNFRCKTGFTIDEFKG
jgi:hypothetical protein